MLVGSAQVRLFIGEAGSLKEKRRIIKSLKDNIHNKFNASVAETDHLDKWQSAVLGVAVVGKEKRHIESVLTGIINYIKVFRSCQLVDYDMEIY